MSAEQSLREGNLAEALAQLQDQVRREPANAKHRVFLFQLLSVMGDWKRALTQLNVAGEMDGLNALMTQMYAPALQCEALRAEVFAGRRSPVIFGDPEPWMGQLLQANTLAAQGEHAASQRLREQALAEAPATPGTIDGEPFEWIGDADLRMGPMLELILNGKYCWAPFHRISVIRTERPVDLRDVVWLPAQLQWTNGGEAVALIPARYAGSEGSADAQVRLGRKTDWLEQGEGLAVGLGQRLLATDAGDYPLLEVREILLGEASAVGAAERAQEQPDG